VDRLIVRVPNAPALKAPRLDDDAGRSGRTGTGDAWIADSRWFR
jgi:hypothetical protein